jgi:hypothetical protein
MGIEVNEIATTQDTGESVFRAKSDKARMEFLFSTTTEHDMIIHMVTSEEPGGMSELLDYICGKYDCEHLRFSTPIGTALQEKLNGFEKVIETVERDGRNMRWECFDGHWNVD